MKLNEFCMANLSPGVVLQVVCTSGQKKLQAV
jgi:hypothetical protein